MDAIQHRSLQEVEIAEAGLHPRFSDINTSNDGLLDPHPRFSDYQHLPIGESERSSTGVIYDDRDIRTSAYSDRMFQRGSQATLRSNRRVSAIYGDSLISRDSGSIRENALRRTVLYDNAPRSDQSYDDDDASLQEFSGRDSLRHAGRDEGSSSGRQASLPSSNTPKPPPDGTTSPADDTLESISPRLRGMRSWNPDPHTRSGAWNVRSSLVLMQERKDRKQDFGAVMQELKDMTPEDPELKRGIRDSLALFRRARDSTPDSLSPTEEFSAPSQPTKTSLAPEQESEDKARKPSPLERQPEYHTPAAPPTTPVIAAPSFRTQTEVSHADLKEIIDVYPLFTCARIIRRVVHKYRLEGIWTDYSLHIRYDGTQEELVDLDEPPGMSVDAMASQGRKPEYVLRTVGRREDSAFVGSVNVLDVTELEAKEAAEAAKVAKAAKEAVKEERRQKVLSTGMAKWWALSMGAAAPR
jgi:hypothetical protein